LPEGKVVNLMVIETEDLHAWLKKVEKVKVSEE